MKHCSVVSVQAMSSELLISVSRMNICCGKEKHIESSSCVFGPCTLQTQYEVNGCCWLGPCTLQTEVARRRILASHCRKHSAPILYLSSYSRISSPEHGLLHQVALQATRRSASVPPLNHWKTFLTRSKAALPTANHLQNNHVD
jgi:hypothetical protein